MIFGNLKFLNKRSSADISFKIRENELCRIFIASELTRSSVHPKFVSAEMKFTHMRLTITFGKRSKFYPSHTKRKKIIFMNFTLNVSVILDLSITICFIFNKETKNNNEVIFAACRDVLLVKIQSYQVKLKTCLIARR